MAIQKIDDLVAALRVELGLAANDASQDPWIEARANAALEAMRRWCRRYLWPASKFRDAFLMGDLFACNRCGGGVVTLGEIPVQSLESILVDQTPQAIADFLVLPTGRLYRKNGTQLAPMIAFGQVVIDYTAGYTDLPADLYEVVAGVVEKAWSATEQGRADALQNVDKLTVFDVGSVEFSGAGDAFYESNIKGAAPNPILGPWSAQLDSYRDYGRGIGLPVSRETSRVGDAAAAAKASA